MAACPTCHQVATTVSATWSQSAAGVATIATANPTVTANANPLFSDAYRLTIQGKGFDATRDCLQPCEPSSLSLRYYNGIVANVVHFSGVPRPPNDQTKTVVKGLVSRATPTQLWVSFTHLAPYNGGVLQAGVTVWGTWSMASMATVSKINAVVPTVQPNQNFQLDTDMPQLTINGECSLCCGALVASASTAPMHACAKRRTV